jgi:hypothetical protein
MLVVVEVVEVLLHTVRLVLLVALVVGEQEG